MWSNFSLFLFLTWRFALKCIGWVRLGLFEGFLLQLFVDSWRNQLKQRWKQVRLRLGLEIEPWILNFISKTLLWLLLKLVHNLGSLIYWPSGTSFRIMGILYSANDWGSALWFKYHCSGAAAELVEHPSKVPVFYNSTDMGLNHKRDMSSLSLSLSDDAVA